ncbi:40S ribosomal protein S7, partial [Chondrus crispus]
WLLTRSRRKRALRPRSSRLTSHRRWRIWNRAAPKSKPSCASFSFPPPRRLTFPAGRRPSSSLSRTVSSPNSTRFRPVSCASWRRSSLESPSSSLPSAGFCHGKRRVAVCKSKSARGPALSLAYTSRSSRIWSSPPKLSASVFATRSTDRACLGSSLILKINKTQSTRPRLFSRCTRSLLAKTSASSSRSRLSNIMVSSTFVQSGILFLP